ncbi:hypothetical protein D3C72_2086310 [compost metagenome]
MSLENASGTRKHNARKMRLHFRIKRSFIVRYHLYHGVSRAWSRFSGGANITSRHFDRIICPAKGVPADGRIACAEARVKRVGIDIAV